MTPDALRRRLDGVIAFCPTPFGDDDSLDLDALAGQVAFLCDTAACAIAVCGGVGEYYALEEAEHRAVVETAVAVAAPRLPVVVGIGAATRIACRLAEHAAAAGAAGVLVNPLPFVEADGEGLRAHYEAIGRAGGLGTIIFGHRRATYDLPTLVALAGLDSVVGYKDETGEVEAFAAARAAIGPRLAWINGCGEPLAAAYAAAGAEAMTSGIVNFAPRLTFAVWEAAAAGDLGRVEQLVARHVEPIAGLRRRRPGYSTTVVKEAMVLCGRPGGAVRAPLHPLAAAEREELAGVLARLPDARELEPV